MDTSVISFANPFGEHKNVTSNRLLSSPYPSFPVSTFDLHFLQIRKHFFMKRLQKRHERVHLQARVYPSLPRFSVYSLNWAVPDSRGSQSRRCGKNCARLRPRGVLRSTERAATAARASRSLGAVAGLSTERDCCLAGSFYLGITRNAELFEHVGVLSDLHEKERECDVQRVIWGERGKRKRDCWWWRIPSSVQRKWNRFLRHWLRYLHESEFKHELSKDTMRAPSDLRIML